MKLNLVFGDAAPREGYINISPVAAGCVYASFSDLDEVVEDAEATEIVARDVLDFLPAPAFDATVAHWVRKLRRGGVLEVRGLDLPEVGRQLASGRLDVATANRLVYGNQTVPAECRKSAASLPLVEALLVAHGLEVRTRACEGPFFVLTARRPA